MQRGGWYWVKQEVESPWEVTRLSQDWWNSVETGEISIEDFWVIVGDRIPDPEEGWMYVPIEPSEEMKWVADIETPGPMTAWKCWQVMLGKVPNR